MDFYYKRQKLNITDLVLPQLAAWLYSPSPLPGKKTGDLKRGDGREGKQKNRREGRGKRDDNDGDGYFNSTYYQLHLCYCFWQSLWCDMDFPSAAEYRIRRIFWSNRKSAEKYIMAADINPKLSNLISHCKSSLKFGKICCIYQNSWTVIQSKLPILLPASLKSFASSLLCIQQNKVSTQKF